MQIKKIFTQKILKYFFYTFELKSQHIYEFFSSSSLSGVSSLMVFPFFAICVMDTGGKFAAGINDTSGIGGKFTAGVVDTSGVP